ncbi:hypothetical protein HN011_012289 [Eciton burchellii]|nr:hypothetical protein HN011_012289 [Eciton burchellii]
MVVRKRQRKTSASSGENRDQKTSAPSAKESDEPLTHRDEFHQSWRCAACARRLFGERVFRHSGIGEEHGEERHTGVASSKGIPRDNIIIKYMANHRSGFLRVAKRH